jgi:hypothetical protein
METRRRCCRGNPAQNPLAVRDSRARTLRTPRRMRADFSCHEGHAGRPHREASVLVQLQARLRAFQGLSLDRGA